MEKLISTIKNNGQDYFSSDTHKRYIISSNDDSTLNLDVYNTGYMIIIESRNISINLYLYLYFNLDNLLYRIIVFRVTKSGLCREVQIPYTTGN